MNSPLRPTLNRSHADMKHSHLVQNHPGHFRTSYGGKKTADNTSF